MKFLAANIKEGEWNWLWWVWKIRWWMVAGSFALLLILIAAIFLLSR